MKKQTTYIAIVTLFLMLLAGCADNSGAKTTEIPTQAATEAATKTPTEAETPTKAATATPEPATPTPEPLAWTSYEKVSEKGLYRVPVKELENGAQIMNAKSAGEYVLMQIWLDSDNVQGPEWGRLLLLRPAVSEKYVSIMPEYPVSSFYLLEDGTVLLEENTTGKLHILDSSLKETASATPEGATGPCLVWVTEDGHIWTRNTDAGVLTVTDLKFENKTEYNTGKGSFIFQFLGSYDGKMNFRMLRAGDNVSCLLSVDTATGKVEETVEQGYDISSGKIEQYVSTVSDMFYHASQETWYLHDLTTDGHWIMLPKYFRYENIDLHDGKTLGVSGTQYTNDFDDQPDTYGCRIYDTEKATIRGELSSKDFEKCIALSILGVQERGLAVLKLCKDEVTTELILWDLSEEEDKKLAGCFDFTEQTPEACLDQLCSEYRELYGIVYKPTEQKTIDRDSTIVTLQKVDLLNGVARGITLNSAEFPKDADGIALRLENGGAHERGNAKLTTHVFSELSTSHYGEAKKQALFNLVDALREGKDTFEAADIGAYSWTVGRLSTYFYPASTACIDTNNINDDNFKDGTATVPYIVSKEEAKKLQEEFDQLVLDTINDAVSDDYTDFEKALALYEFITLNWTYDYELYEHNGEPEWMDKGSVYRCLKDKLGICWELAGMYNYLLEQCGINAEESGGFLISKSESHAWTFIKLNGEYYNVDVTWGLTEDGLSNLQYFLTTDKIREENDGFPIDMMYFSGTDELSRTSCSMHATDESFAPLWEGRYVGMDRTAKNVIYWDANGILRTFSYEAK